MQCEGVTGVSSSQVEMSSGLQFYDGHYPQMKFNKF